jgi:hypothetical protein
MLPFQDCATPVMTGKLSIGDALPESQRLAQQVLDRYLVKASAVGL